MIECLISENKEMQFMATTNEYKTLYTQLETEAQKESYPVLYKYHHSDDFHHGREIWDFYYGCISAEDFIQHNYTHPLERQTATPQDMDTVLQFMQDFVEKEGKPDEEYTPVSIKEVGNTEKIALGRCHVFGKFLASKGLLKDTEKIPELTFPIPKDPGEPPAYDYAKLAEEVSKTDGFYSKGDEFGCSFNGMRNHFKMDWFDTAEKFYLHQVLFPLYYAETYTIQIPMTETDADKEILQKNIDYTLAAEKNGMQFIKDYLGLAAGSDMNPYFEFADIGDEGNCVAIDFNFIYKQLRHHVHPFAVESLVDGFYDNMPAYEGTHQKYVHAPSIWSKAYYIP